MIDPQISALLKASVDKPSSANFEERRRGFAADLAAIDAPGPQMKTERTIEIPVKDMVLPARLFIPEVEVERPLLLYLHGGGWIQGSIDTHASTCRYLAHHGGMDVLAASYRLAPEHGFPAPVLDVMCVWRWVARHRHELDVSASSIAIGGDSAGANLAVAAALAQLDEPGCRPTAILAVYPALDLSTRRPSRDLFGKGFWLDSLDELINLYVPNAAERTTPLASPLLSGRLAELPPSMIVTAGFDPLRDEGAEFVERLLDGGGRCLRWHEGGMIHGFMALHGIVDSARSALIGIARGFSAFLHTTEARTDGEGRAG